MDLHPLCELFPRMTETEFTALKVDIEVNGLRQAIITLDGKILDGANRYRACTELGVPPIMTSYTGRDPLAYVLSANLHRRHLDASQRSLIASNVANMRQGERSDLPSIGGKLSRSDAGKLLNVSEKSVERAAKVITDGVPELVEAVKSGTISVSAAAVVATLPKPAQVAAVEQGNVAVVVRQIHAKPPKAPEPEPTAGAASYSDAERDADLAQDYEREVTENAQLRQRIESLTADDQAAELDRANLRIAHLDLHVRSVQTTLHEAEKMVKYRGALLERIRKALGVERDRDIVTAITALKGGAQ